MVVIILGTILHLLEMSQEVSASSCGSNLNRAASYQPIENHALRGQSFLNVSGISAIRCSARCLSHKRCFSFNYDRINKVCQMNNATKDQVGDWFHQSEHFSYYDIPSAEMSTAKTTHCQNNDVTQLEETTTPKARTTIAPCVSPVRLGLEDGSIPDANITASSNWLAQGVYAGISTPADGRLNKIPPDDITIGAWQPSVADTNQWIQVDLGKLTYVYGILMQGRQDQNNQWVTKYKVQYEPPSQASLVDVQNQLGGTQVCDGNVNAQDIVESLFAEPVLAVKVRIVPLEWNDFIALRFELLGCK